MREGAGLMDTGRGDRAGVGAGATRIQELCCGLDKDMGNGPYMNDSGEFLGQAGAANDSGKFLGQVDADEQVLWVGNDELFRGMGHGYSRIGPCCCKNGSRKWNSTKRLRRLIPVWVKLFDVPLEFWSPDGLSYIASGVGKPLGMDKITEDTCRIRMPNEVNDESKIMGVRVDYQWRPSQCERCCEFGHGDTSCARLPRIEDKGTRTGKTKITVVENDGFQIVNRKGKGKMPRRSQSGYESQYPARGGGHPKEGKLGSFARRPKVVVYPKKSSLDQH
ncbi:hypothetical protein Pint_29784 [Pistacia integerrima]|uniref:Uncharacterized protein n=1 Tax=Pistacia integerrima TaxID=434235 RepID=A0ACC0X0J1_9ROSI|nr:hypothetical protein Pint_29784 [Pistacia integerrima]